MSDIELVDLNPVEWDLKRFRCYRYLKVSIDSEITKDRLEQKMRESNIKNVSLTENPSHWITWQRKNRPTIYIDLESQSLRVPKATLVKYDTEDLEYQASLILRLLRKFGLATFLRKRVDFLPSRIGFNELERKQYHELIERGIQRRKEIYGCAPIANRRMSRKRVNERKDYSALKRHIDESNQQREGVKETVTIVLEKAD